LKPGGRLVAAGENPANSQEELESQLEALREAGEDDELGYTLSELALDLSNCLFGSIEYVKIKYQKDMTYMQRDQLVEDGHGYDNGLILAIKSV
jgi:hypothetical protein